MVLVAVVAVFFVATILIDQTLTAGALSLSERSSAAPPIENNPVEALAANKSGVLRLPPLEPELWRSTKNPLHSPLAPAPTLLRPAFVPLQSNEPGLDNAPVTVRTSGESVVKLVQASSASEAGKPAPSLLVTYGNEYLARADVAAARLLYRRAADDGSASGAAALAASYDPVYLNQRALRGVRSDPKEALRWYHVATEMGDPSAAGHITALMEWLRSAALAGDNNARALLEQASR